MKEGNLIQGAIKCKVGTGKDKGFAQGVSGVDVDNAAATYKVMVADESMDKKAKQMVSEGKSLICQTEKNGIERAFDQVKTWANRIYDNMMSTAGSKAFYTALQKSLNTIALDTATWLGSGGQGQKPLFVTEGWGTYLRNIGDNAAGSFIESFGKSNNFNLCQPSNGVRIQIGLGLIKTQKPTAPACTFTKMKSNWDKAIKDPKFLLNFQDMFNPESNDLGIALSLQTGMLSEINAKVSVADLGLQTNKGWLDVRSIGGNLISDPQAAERRRQQIDNMQWSNLAEYTGDAFVDAANIFINQLALTLFNRLMGKLGEGKSNVTTSYTGDYGGLTNYYSSGGGGGISSTKDYLRELTEPKFNERGDYNILAELTLCPDPNKAGPTNCVIDDKFSQAVINKVTVGQALSLGYLDPNGIFGFSSDGLEPKYNEGYPYRSQIILRKFRILPVGWEVASQYIKDHPNEIGSTKNLQDLVNCFDNDDEYEGYEATWCNGLVDPSWVLKAPKNYCKREGYGSEIKSQEVSGEGTASYLAVDRNDKYCADEQACIKENDDGTCKMYGYCTEERRKWDFNAKSCEAKYNTCQSYRASDGSTVAYLEDTLNMSVCDSGNAGCRAYTTKALSYDSDNDLVTWSTSSPAYFNKNISTCDSSQEGCHGFIRTREGTNANILMNSSFEDDEWGWNFNSSTGGSSVAIDQTEYSDGTKSLKIDNDNAGGYSSANARIGGIVSGQNITVSYMVKSGLTTGTTTGAWLAVYTYGANNTLIRDQKTDDAYQTNSVVKTGYTGDNVWKQIEFSFVAPEGTESIVIEPRVEAVVGSAYFDSIKVEYGKGSTAYNDYKANTVIFEKLLPYYLYNSCYLDPAAGDYSLRSDAPDACKNFVRLCNQEEVNCEMYTAKKDSLKVPAKVSAEDVCPSECLDYNTYVQGETTFDSMRDEYFIPSTAKTCNAAAAGCDEFTNLDDLNLGAEAKNYFSYLRQCVKTSDSDCTDFYTWEGSSETGYQLKTFTLKGEIVNEVLQPVTTEDKSAVCNETIYNKPASDPAFNADCRQFYNSNGQVSYRSYSYTVACNDNCHPYRRTENNVDPRITESSQCVGNDKHWDDTNQECIYCKNGGTWNEQQNACLYMAIPSDGIVCAASQNGCREYGGNAGNNVQTVLSDDFESTTTSSWANGTIDTESLTVGEHSLKVTGESTSYVVGTLVEKDNSYILSFLAKSDGATAIKKISLSDGAYTSEFNLLKTPLGANWQQYEFNLSKLDHVASTSEKLIIETEGSGFYIDNAKLQKITDKYYLIKNSWTTPSSCDQDIEGNPAPGYMLGCSAYTDRAGMNFNFHSFSVLCQDSAVGCEAMFDTQNSTEYKEATSSTGVVVPADKPIYVVYDEDKKCDDDMKGCMRTSMINHYDQTTTVGSDKYLVNNPDKYGTILCGSDAVGCDEYVTSDGSSYFKDPGDQTCEWRQKAGAGAESWSWYKKKVKKCDKNSDGKILSASTEEVNSYCSTAANCDVVSEAACSKDSDCGANQTCANKKCHYSCIQDDNEYSCPTDPYKTFGQGGTGNRVLQPTNYNGTYWAGLCPVSESGCTEYIDPVSSFSANILFNYNYQQDVDNDGKPDGWKIVNSQAIQDVDLSNFTLYRLSRNENSGTLTLTCGSGNLYVLNSENSLVSSAANVTLAATSTDSSLLFYTINVSNCKIYNTEYSKSDGPAEIKKAMVDYQLRQNIDKTTCNGGISLKEGCVLFNERKQVGQNVSNLTWDADLTKKNKASTPPQTGVISERDANQIIKVTPDRVCNQWLACRSYIKDTDGKNVCFDIGACDGIDDNGNCNSFLMPKKENQILTQNLSAGVISNYSGYNKAGYDSDNSLKSDYYPLGVMKQVGDGANVSNGGFEFADSSLYPIGWSYEGGSGYSNDAWDTNIFTVIADPITAQTEGIGYAPEGGSFLKVGAKYSATSEYFDVLQGQKYILSAYLNTVNISDGAAKVRIGDDEILSMDSGNGWQFKLNTFTAKTTRIQVTVYSTATNGKVYFDDIKVKPALDSRIDNTTKTNWYVPQTCRLYPKSDSLSCDYYEDSGKRQRGWSGYCLEYDRGPGSQNTCLLWWPIDKVKGEGVEEGAGYIGKIPVYYCTEAKMFNLLEYRQRVEGVPEPAEPFDGWCMPARFFTECGGSMCPGYGQHVGGGTCYALPTGTCRYGCSGTSGWYDYNGFVLDEAGSGVKFYDPDTGEVYDDIFAKCTKVVKTVTNLGDNKYWSGRVYEGSDYVAAPGILNYTYTTDSEPFGSVVPPSPTSNPYEWDGDTLAGIQPLIVRTSGVRAGSPYLFVTPSSGTVGTVGACSVTKKLCYHVAGLTYEKNKADCNSGEGDCVAFNFPGNYSALDPIKRLFAQSYGQWTWNETKKRYVKDANESWGPPETKCPGNVRPADPNDYCANVPTVFNVKVENNSSLVKITKNKVINLTFNTQIDSQQMPMVMFAVDWGDDEGTTVSGVEMRSRSNVDSPHSLYHLYSYWDVKAKANMNLPGVNITCVDSGEQIGSYTCPTDIGCCGVKPKVKIKDNWGWCNGGTYLNDCEHWEEYPGWIIINEK